MENQDLFETTYEEDFSEHDLKRSLDNIQGLQGLLPVIKSGLNHKIKLTGVP